MMMDDCDRTKMKKIDLIQQATTRLRRKQLEEQLCDMMSGLTNIQIQSKHIYDQLSDTMATTQQLTNYGIEQQREQMDLLENQIKLHRAILQQWFPLMSSFTTTGSYIPRDTNDDSYSETSSNECDDMDDTKTSTMSRLSSLSMISSLFSRPISRSTSISEFTDNMDGRRNLNNIGGQPPANSPAMEQQWNQLYRYQRRLRVKNHRQRHQHRQRSNNDGDRDNVLADFAIASTASLSPTTKNHNSYSGKHLSGTSLTPTSTYRASPRSTASTSVVALSLKPTHAYPSEAPSSTIPLPSPPLTPMSCQTPSPQENAYHHDSDDMLSTSSYSQYEFGSNKGESTNTSDGYLEMDQYRYQHQRTEAAFSSSSSMSMPHSSYSVDQAKNWRQYSEHKALDDNTMDILEQMDAMEKEGYDEFFFQDMAFLLDHPDLCSQPLTDLAPLLEQQHHYLEQTLSGDKDGSFSSSSGWAHGPSSGAMTPYIQHLCSSGWQWYRFVSILSVSYMVSLLKGPDDLLVD